jgi:TolB-like protein
MVHEENASPPGNAVRSDDVLGSWKEIARYLHRDVRTVMRWEQMRAMPVHRLPGGPKAPVHALRSELDAWRSGRTDAELDARVEPVRAVRSATHVPVALAAIALSAIAAAIAVWLLWPTRPAPPPPIRSLAVLPFVNLNSDPADDYLAAGLHDLLITALARSTDVSITARSSVESFAAKAPVREIAAQLHVDALVEGSVLRSGGRVLISVKLVRADTEAYVWAGRYERDVVDVLDLIDEVASAVTTEVRDVVAGTGAGSPSAAARAARPIKPEALELYVRGRYAFLQLNREGFDQALRLYRQAVDTDPGFTLGWSGIAATLTAQAFFGIVTPAEALPQAREAAERALAIDAQLGEAHGSLGYIALYFDRDFDAARRKLELAVALVPNSMMVRHEYADYLLTKGQVEESLRQVEAGRETDPLSLPANGVVIYHALMAGRYATVVTEGQRLMEAQPNRGAVRDWVSRALWLLGRHEEALALMRPDFGADALGWEQVEQAYRERGAKAAMALLAARRAAREPKGLQAGAFSTALLFGAAGDAGNALHWLEQSDARREPFLLHAGADPFLDPVRGDPRIKAFLARLGIASIQR